MTPTVAGALADAQRLGIARLDAQLLLAHLLGQPRTWLIAHDDQVLTPSQVEQWQGLLARRSRGEPLAYLTGWRDFFGLDVQVTADVLVPRPETEHLVAWALERIDPDGDPQVLDLGTGSGAIALALRHQRPGCAVTAVDRSAAALAVARANGERLGLAVHWRLGDWLDAVPGQRFDLIVSNPPYVADGDPHLAALRHEPQLALVAGPDGLAALRRIIGSAGDHLRPGGWLLLEHGFDQAGPVRQALQQHGFQAVVSRTDLAGHERCSGGQRPATGALWPADDASVRRPAGV